MCVYVCEECECVYVVCVLCVCCRGQTQHLMQDKCLPCLMCVSALTLGCIPLCSVQGVPLMHLTNFPFPLTFSYNGRLVRTEATPACHWC